MKLVLVTFCVLAAFASRSYSTAIHQPKENCEKEYEKDVKSILIQYLKGLTCPCDENNPTIDKYTKEIIKQCKECSKEHDHSFASCKETCKGKMEEQLKKLSDDLHCSCQNGDAVRQEYADKLYARCSEFQEKCHVEQNPHEDCIEKLNNVVKQSLTNFTSEIDCKCDHFEAILEKYSSDIVKKCFKNEKCDSQQGCQDKCKEETEEIFKKLVSEMKCSSNDEQMKKYVEKVCAECAYYKEHCPKNCETEFKNDVKETVTEYMAATNCKCDNARTIDKYVNQIVSQCKQCSKGEGHHSEECKENCKQKIEEILNKMMTDFKCTCDQSNSLSKEYAEKIYVKCTAYKEKCEKHQPQKDCEFQYRNDMKKIVEEFFKVTHCKVDNKHIGGYVEQIFKGCKGCSKENGHTPVDCMPTCKHQAEETFKKMLSNSQCTCDQPETIIKEYVEKITEITLNYKEKCKKTKEHKGKECEEKYNKDVEKILEQLLSECKCQVNEAIVEQYSKKLSKECKECTKQNCFTACKDQCKDKTKGILNKLLAELSSTCEQSEVLIEKYADKLCSDCTKFKEECEKHKPSQHCNVEERCKAEARKTVTEFMQESHCNCDLNGKPVEHAIDELTKECLKLNECEEQHSHKQHSPPPPCPPCKCTTQ